MTDHTLKLRVANRQPAAEDIVTMDLVHPDGSELPPFTAGSHIDVYAPGGYLRQYSLCNDPADRLRYRIGVLREAGGSGGSAAMHTQVDDGDLLEVGRPRNSFRLVEDASYSILLAGGIGVTPILSMVHRLHALDRPFELHYCTRTRVRTAFLDELQRSEFAERVHFHFDDGAADQLLNFTALLGRRPTGAELYICGPTGFMAAAVGAAEPAWPATNVHREYFANDPQAGRDAEAFTVRIASSGAEFRIPEDRTIVEVLRDHGIEVPVSCEQGICGTCLTGVLEGIPDHRDLFMTDAEHDANDRMTLCCSRARSGLIVLDL